MTIVTIADPETHDLLEQQVSDVELLSHMQDNESRIKALFKNQLMSDAVFVVEGKHIPVHSFVLRLASPVFNVMFSQTWKQDEPIVIPDFNSSPFLSLMRWIYRQEVVVIDGQMLDLMRLASKYMVHSLLKAVTLDSAEEHIWSLTAHAADQEDEERQEQSWLKILSQTRALIQQPDFLHATPDLVRALVSQSGLCVREIELFEACYKWSEAECRRQRLEVTDQNRRRVMDPFVREFGFQTMDPSDFAGLPCHVLTHEEQALVFRFLHRKLTDTPFRSIARKVLNEGQVLTPDHLTIGTIRRPSIRQSISPTSAKKTEVREDQFKLPPIISFTPPDSKPIFRAQPHFIDSVEKRTDIFGTRISNRGK